MRRVVPILSLLALVATGCSKQRDRTVVPPQTLAVVKAAEQQVTETMRFPARINSNVDVVIQPRVSGYLLKKNYSKGMPVRKGQLLYQIDPSQLDLTVAANQAALASARVQLVEADNNYRRAVPLAAINAISQSALDQYRASYAAAQANLRSAETQLNNSQIEQQYASIYSPIDGIIGDTDAVEGDLVGPGSEFSTLSTISDISIVSVNLSMPVSQYLQLRGAERDTLPTFQNENFLTDITLYLPDGTPYPYRGHYAYTEKNIGSSSGNIVFVVKFDNPDRLLKSGQYASVSARVGAAAGVVLVPQRAINQTQGINSLWIVRPDSTLEYRKVGLGDTFGNLWIVRSGVERGETVLVDGQTKARNGMKIDPRYQSSDQTN